MKVKLNSLRTIAVFLTAIFLMYQETPALPKRSAAGKTQPTQAQAAAPDISYVVSMSKPSTHLLEVEMRVKWTSAHGTVELKMPV